MSDIALEAWKREMAKFEKPRILACGARMWQNSIPYQYELNAPHGEWVKSDKISGPGVELELDLEDIPVPHPSFDGICCPSVLEHVTRPWIAMENMMIMLKKPGLLYVASHQTFPLHYYPNDYFRFSIDAMKVMAEDAGLRVIEACYCRPARIVPPPEVTVWNQAAPAYLDVAICAIRD